VLIEGFVTGAWAENAYILAAGPQCECLIVDPGQGSLPRIAETVRRHGLQPVAVLLTHGHLDHAWDLVAVCQEYRIGAWCHPADGWLLADPTGGLGPAVAASLAAMAGEDLPSLLPAELSDLADGQRLTLAGLPVAVLHTPGHTPGSCVLLIGDDPTVMLAGDLLFAGSIGRTDLPGGEPAAMTASLTRVMAVLADDTEVLPGHGPATSIGAERHANPFLPNLSAAGPRQGR